MSSTLTNLLYHIVFSTKNREPIITAPIRANLYKYMGGIVRGEGGTLIEIGGMPNHVHVLAQFPNEGQLKARCRAWKHYTALEINQHLHFSGRFWQVESFDHLVRSPEQFAYFRDYIFRNGPSAGLKPGEYRYYRRPDQGSPLTP